MIFSVEPSASGRCKASSKMVGASRSTPGGSVVLKITVRSENHPEDLAAPHLSRSSSIPSLEGLKIQ